MADFVKAYRITVLGNEGGYDPGTHEKETYRGIDRGANPNWSGWHFIDALKKGTPGISVKDINTHLAANQIFQAAIEKFYRENYWNTVKLDYVNDQQISNTLFDCSVNQGEGIARKFMQLACNAVIVQTASKMHMLAVDGNPGVKTLGAVNSLPFKKLHAEINRLRLERYRNTKDYEYWGKVWEARLKPYV